MDIIISSIKSKNSIQWVDFQNSIPRYHILFERSANALYSNWYFFSGPHIVYDLNIARDVFSVECFHHSKEGMFDRLLWVLKLICQGYKNFGSSRRSWRNIGTDPKVKFLAFWRCFFLTLNKSVRIIAMVRVIILKCVMVRFLHLWNWRQPSPIRWLATSPCICKMASEPPLVHVRIDISNRSFRRFFCCAVFMG